MARWGPAVVLSACALVGAEASSMYVAQLCMGGTCPDPMFPVLDYEPHGNGTCLCRAHPCWASRYHVKSCEDPAKPYLHVSYNKIKAFQCECKPEPVYDSVHIQRDRCPGESCPAEYTILDWDPHKEKCICRGHPCDNIGGKKFECNDPAFPIRHFLETSNSTGQPTCECRTRMERPVSRLRGRSAEEMPNATECLWQDMPSIAGSSFM